MGKIYGCADGEDNDGDGLVDLEDPECLSPCEDDESAFAPGVPGQWDYCHLDCAFDGNYGPGDDECRNNLHCDPLAPADAWGCTYNPGSSCEPALGDACRSFCEPFTPNGCDCWGCCTIEVDGQSRNILTTLDSECSLSNLEACPECTQQMELCGNPCDAENCEVCFGETEPMPGCFAAACPGAQPCDDHCDCADEGYCLQGCCHPAPQG
jgi:hypothetical protein